LGNLKLEKKSQQKFTANSLGACDMKGYRIKQLQVVYAYAYAYTTKILYGSHDAIVSMWQKYKIFMILRATITIPKDRSK